MSTRAIRSASVLFSILTLSFIALQCGRRSEAPVSPSAATTDLGSPSMSMSSPGSVVTPLTPPVSNSGYPDLTVDSTRLANSVDIITRTFSSNDCAVVEGCASVGERKLLRFDVVIPNFGTADLQVGNPRKNPALFEYSACHGHYHYKDFSEYRLKNASGVVVRSRKQAFCFMDIVQYWPDSPSRRYTCNKQGISVGWADVYGRYLDCQWIDITDVSSGDYLVEVEINKAGAFNEGENRYPDLVAAPVRIP